MEIMPYSPDAQPTPIDLIGIELAAVSTDWTTQLPVLEGRDITLRELRASDAPALLAQLTTEEVSRFITPPPTTVAGFEKFIAWTHARRAAGEFICFGVVPKGQDTPIGIFQVRSLETGFSVAEWGFALGSGYWGTGMFAEGAQMVIDFAFEAVGIRRLEARASVENGRGNGALKKLGAVAEGILRDAFVKDGRHHDQVIWSLLASDRRCGAAVKPAMVQ